MRRVALLLLVCGLLVLGGCTAPAAEKTFDGGDELGVVEGHAADDSLDVDADDGLDEDELEAITYRSMARIEELRGVAFESDVEVEVIDREELRERWGDAEPADAFTNEVWRAAFVVDGETDVNEAQDAIYRDAVQGYYRGGEIVVVAEDADRVHLDRRTFVHELVHALQDQHVGIAVEGETIDERRAHGGLLEGEAEYLPDLYNERCEDDWECLPDLAEEPGPGPAVTVDVGLFLSIYAPYSEGPPFVAHLHEEGGWDAVDAAHDDPPTSTSQLIEPESYPEDEPRSPSVEDRSGDGWEPVTDAAGEVRTETIGEATLFATFYEEGLLDRSIDEGGTERSPFNYSHPITDGWAGDRLVVYQETGASAGDDAIGEVDEPRTGHVWTLAWETEADAEAFHEGYLDLLEHHGAEPVEGADGTYEIPDDEPFAGAYAVSLDGDEVRIVGGPDLDALAEIDSELAAEAGIASISPEPGSAAAGPTAGAPAAEAPAAAS